MTTILRLFCKFGFFAEIIGASLLDLYNLILKIVFNKFLNKKLVEVWKLIIKTNFISDRYFKTGLIKLSVVVIHSFHSLLHHAERCLK